MWREVRLDSGIRVCLVVVSELDYEPIAFLPARGDVSPEAEVARCRAAVGIVGNSNRRSEILGQHLAPAAECAAGLVAGRGVAGDVDHDRLSGRRGQLVSDR